MNSRVADYRGGVQQIFCLFFLCCISTGLLADRPKRYWKPSKFFAPEASPHIMSMPEVQVELGMTGEQVERLQSLKEEIRKQSDLIKLLKTEAFSQLRGVEEKEKQLSIMSSLLEQVRDINSNVRSSAYKLLSSQQLERFKEIQFQYYIHREYYKLALDVYSIEIDDKDEFDELKAELESEYDEQAARLRLAMKKKILATRMPIKEVERVLADEFFEITSSIDTPKPKSKANSKGG